LLNLAVIGPLPDHIYCGAPGHTTRVRQACCVHVCCRGFAPS
jgi:hypothetical protein